ncbi:MAG TPA: hypothetical protein VJA17_03970 [Candidatus Omnitrophota bacterium]|nr:hypothetical protein [Candidatus Omnitrophota bacterium]
MRNKLLTGAIIVIVTLVLSQAWYRMGEAQYDTIRKNEKVQMPEFETDRTMLKQIVSYEQESLQLLREIKSLVAGMKGAQESK